jgi:hypothetical protein
LGVEKKWEQEESKQANWREKQSAPFESREGKTHNLLTSLPPQLRHLIVALSEVKTQNPLVRENPPTNRLPASLVALFLLPFPLSDRPFEGGRRSGADKGVVGAMVGFERFEGGERRGRGVAGRREGAGVS